MSKSCLAKRKYRNFFEISASILKLAKNTFVSKFFLIKNVGTNSRHINGYLDILVQRGLMEINYKDGRILYRTNERGLIFLKYYEVLREMLFGAGARPPVIMTEAFLPLKGEKGAHSIHGVRDY